MFDAEYYAQNNPDVVAAFGTDANALYLHFVKYGVNEGRLPFVPGTDWQSILNSNSTTTVATSTVTTTASTTTTAATNTTVGTNKCPYELYKLYDEGNGIVYFYGYCPFDNTALKDEYMNNHKSEWFSLDLKMLNTINEELGTNYSITSYFGVDVVTGIDYPHEVYSDTGCVVRRRVTLF